MAIDARPEITRAPVTATVIGLLAGMFSALLGVGGGLVMVPAMAFLLRVRHQRAHGTSLAVIFPTAVAAVYQYATHSDIRWNIVLWLALGSVIGAAMGARLTATLKAPRLRQAFGVLVVLTGVAMIAFSAASGGEQRALIPTDIHDWPVILAVGAISGMLSGVLGVGGGLVMIPALVFLLGLPQKVAQGISLAVIIPVAVSGALIHCAKGNVIPSLAGWLACGAAIGATVVGHFVGRIDDETLKMLFGVYLIIVGVTMVNRGRRPAPAQG